MVPPMIAPPGRLRFLLLADLFLIATGVLASFALRLDLGPLFVSYLPHAWAMIGVALVIKPAVYYLFGLYRRYWAYASIREMLTISLATAAASSGVAVVVILLIVSGALPNFPRSVLGIDWRPDQPEGRPAGAPAPRGRCGRGRRRGAGRARDAAQPAALDAAGGFCRRRPREAAQGYPRRAGGRHAA
jgi:hypothetical protein